jgi:hypothetical protein
MIEDRNVRAMRAPAHIIRRSISRPAPQAVC